MNLNTAYLTALAVERMRALAAAPMPKPKEVVREAYRPPSQEEWTATFNMLCMHCENWKSCHLVEQMIEAKDGAPWPAEAWVTDPGAGVTCLSYSPKSRPALPRQQLRALDRVPESQLPPVCNGCAARKGSEASVSLHTQRDYRQSVQDQASFVCHEDPAHQRLCGGWCRAVRARRAGKENSG